MRKYKCITYFSDLCLPCHLCHSNKSASLFSQNLALLVFFCCTFLHFLHLFFIFFCTSSALFCTYFLHLHLSFFFTSFLHFFFLVAPLLHFSHLSHISSLLVSFLHFFYHISFTHLFCINFAFLMHFSASLLTVAASLLHLFRTIPTPLSYLFRICSAPFYIVSAYLP